MRYNFLPLNPTRQNARKTNTKTKKTGCSLKYKIHGPIQRLNPSPQKNTNLYQGDIFFSIYNSITPALKQFRREPHHRSRNKKKEKN